MAQEFEKLLPRELELLQKAPAMVSVLASMGRGEINEWEKADAIKLAHLRTFTAPPLLIAYYKEVDKTFEQDFEEIAKKYAPFDQKHRAMLLQDLNEVNKVIAKMGTRYANTLQKSLSDYADHVKKAYKGLVVNFIFPFPIPGLSE